MWSNECLFSSAQCHLIWLVGAHSKSYMEDWAITGGWVLCCKWHSFATLWYSLIDSGKKWVVFILCCKCKARPVEIMLRNWILATERLQTHEAWCSLKWHVIIMPQCACAAKAYGSLLVFLSVCHSVCYQDSSSARAIQVLKHAQMGTKPCFLGFKLAQFLR